MGAELSKNEKYTYKDYYSWDDDKRWELLDGVAYMMSSPGRKHQSISGYLHAQFHNFLKGKTCKVFAAPFDVRLDSDGLDDNVVQPDLLVVCDSKKLDDKCCVGVPDLVVEILSPSSVKVDKILKLRLYKRFGVKEIWIVDPVNEVVETYILEENGSYTVDVFDFEIKSRVLEGFAVDLVEMFEYAR